MNSEDDEFKRIEREIKMRQVPDAIHTDLGETLEYITGWNDCRAAMLEQQKPAQQKPAQQKPVYYGDVTGAKEVRTLRNVRFQNTLKDLRECEKELHDLKGNLSELGKEEARAADALIQLCNSIVKGHLNENRN